MTVYDENNVPVLEREPGSKLGLSRDGVKLVASKHEAAQKALGSAASAVAADPSDDDAREALSAVQAKHYLLGESVVVHNKAPAGGGEPSYTHFVIGASTLDEALKEVIGGFDSGHLGAADESIDHVHGPDWVASTHKEFARLLADYYSCEVRDLAEVLA